MNLSILNTDVQNFINEHLNTDISKLLFKGSPFDTISIQELVQQIEAKKRCNIKLPTWFNAENIYYPNKLNIEQTSSEVTAKYKSELVSGSSIIDLTGGFGIDSYYFAKSFKKVIHCEINKELSEIVKHNYHQLNVNTINTFAVDGLKYIEQQKQNFDCIYIDPSRRSDVKGKVFLLKDCLPNVPENLDFLFKHTQTILIKVSPILDISSAINELKSVQEVHVVAVQNEVKELLFILKKDFKNCASIKAINLKRNEIISFYSEFNSKQEALFSLPKKYLYEPNVAILKAGLFNEVSNQLNIYKLNINSHLYTNEKLIKFPGRRFKIVHRLKYDRKEILKLLPEKKANITVRNFPESVTEIRKKTRIKEGGNYYLFFTTDMNNKHIVLACEKV